MNYNTFMTSISLRENILDDLTYLQKHLRLLIKFHQKLSSRLYVTSASNGSEHSPIRSRSFDNVRSLMDELEEEMTDISLEQKILTDIIKSSTIAYNKTFKKKHKVDIDFDTANGFITRALQYHYEKNYFQILPSNVKTRMSEEELQLKYDQVKGDNKADHAMVQLMNQKKEVQPSTSKVVKRESLLKPVFRKPSLSQIQKKTAQAPVAVESRRGRVKKPSKSNPQAITHGRINLLKALSKVKTEQVDNKEGLDKFFSERCRATLAEVGENGSIDKYIRSDEDWSDKSSSYDGSELMEEGESIKVKISRKRRSPGVHSEESSDGDYMKNYPLLPIEPPPKTDFNQEEFLSIFKLITPQVAESLKLRRSERKRRNCTKNEKNDFHYGNFDLNEAAYRFRLNNKRSILYSPNNKKTNGKIGVKRLSNNISTNK